MKTIDYFQKLLIQVKVEQSIHSEERDRSKSEKNNLSKCKTIDYFMKILFPNSVNYI